MLSTAVVGEFVDEVGMNNIDKAVHEVVLEVARKRNEALGGISEDDLLINDLHLQSLDLALIVALLEDRLKADPFAELVPITRVRTVKDVVEAYKLAAEADGPPSSMRGGEDEPPSTRGLIRKDASAAMRNRRKP